MEFVLRQPQDIDINGDFWHLWSNFNEKFKNCQNADIPETFSTDTSSLLLLAAHHQIKTVCSSLQTYNLDLPTLKKILEVVEQACLPYFILLFERFRYFNLKWDPSESVDEFVIFVQKQAEICEFGDLKDRVISKTLSKYQIQDVSNVSEQDISVMNSLPDETKKELDNTDNEDNSIESFFIFSDAESPAHNDSPSDVGKASKMKQFRCCFCKKSFSSELCIRKHHALKHSNNSEYSCKLCRIVFSGLEEYLIHCKNEHVSKRQKLQSSSESQANPSKASTSGNKSSNTLPPREKPVIHKLKEKLTGDPVKKEVMLEPTENFDSLFLHNVKTPLKVTYFEKGKKYNANSKTSKKKKTYYKPKSNFALKSTKKSDTIKQFLCCFCKKSFYGENCLRKHLALKHVGCSQYSCKICKISFFSLEEYLLHCQYEHDIEKLRFQCYSCGDYLQSLTEYRNHCKRHKNPGKFSCDLCQKQLPSIFNLHVHLKNHLMAQNKCDICGMVIIKYKSFLKHLENHKASAFECKICGKTYFKRYRLTYHMRSHTGEKLYTCELCGKSYAQKLNLVIHKRWHAGEKPCECDICGTRFRCSGDLIKHKRKHSAKHAYVCEVCGKGFNYQSALVRHRVGHTGNRPYACDVCGRTFVYSEGVRDHIKANRCPGRRKEPGTGSKETKRATKTLQIVMSDNLIDDGQVQIPETSGRNWHYVVIKNDDADGETNIVLVPTMT